MFYYTFYDALFYRILERNMSGTYRDRGTSMSTTEEFLNELIHTEDIVQTVKEHESDFYETNLSGFFRQMLEKYHLKRLDVIEGANMSISYGYQVMDGVKSPKRDKLIQLCFGFPLNLEELRTALRYGGVNDLDPYIKRDAFIIYAASNGLNLERLNHKFYEAGEEEMGNN